MTYDYRCDACGVVFERQERMSDEPKPLPCECGGTARRLISAGAGVIFKGTGFYATDYRKRTKAAIRDELRSELKSIGVRNIGAKGVRK